METLTVETVLPLPDVYRSEGLVLLPNNEYYVAKGCHIFHINANSEKTLFAGKEDGNEDGLRLEAKTKMATGLCLVQQTKLFFCDEISYVIRLVEDGYMSTYAGNGSLGYVDGPRQKCSLGFPEHIVEFEGCLYVSDYYQRLRKISLKTGMVTSIGGNGTALRDGQLSDCAFLRTGYLALGASRRMLVADQHTIRCIDFSDQSISTVAGSSEKGYFNSKKEKAKFSYVSGVLELPNGDIVVSDSGNNCIRIIKESDGTVYHLAGVKGKEGNQDGPAHTALLRGPSALRLHSNGDLYFNDFLGVKIIRGFYLALIQNVGYFDILATGASDFELNHQVSCTKIPIHLGLFNLWGVEKPKIKQLEESQVDSKILETFLRLLYGSNLIDGASPTVQSSELLYELCHLSDLAGTRKISRWLEQQLASKAGEGALLSQAPHKLDDPAVLLSKKLARRWLKLAAAYSSSGASSSSSQTEPDFTFVVSSSTSQLEMKADSWIVYAKWPYFRRLMNSGLEESRSLRAEIPAEMPQSTLEALLQYFYIGADSGLALIPADAKFIKTQGGQFGIVDMSGNAAPEFRAFVALIKKIRIK